MKFTAHNESFGGMGSGSLVSTIAQQSASVHPVEDAASQAVPPHPLGIRPSGNQYTATHNSRTAIGYFQMLPDEFLQIFLEYLDAGLLKALGSTCKALYAFCSSDDLWKTIFTESGKHGKDFRWRGTWRSTYMSLPLELKANVLCEHLFSDALYRPYMCAHTSLIPYTTNIPVKNQIARLKDITAAEFTEAWCNKPFILTEPIREWPVFQAWDTETLLQSYGDVEFRQESVDWRLKNYVDYMNNTTDESPLYLFDRGFVEKMSISVSRDQADASYWIPDCFGEDLFSVLGTQRPDSRWLIIGPARSGSTFHKDPNATSAWNAVLRGAKYWIMFPTHPDSPPPPGVYVSEDQSEVTSPLSIAEWLIGFHAEARRTPGCLEGICGEGEVLHVPSGWWHLVVNLDASIAITQNFVPRAHLPSVLSFLKDRPGQVSGFKNDVKDPYVTFIEGMKKEHPDLLSEAEAVLERKTAGKKRKWDVAVGNETEAAFSFGFGGDGDSDEDIP